MDKLIQVSSTEKSLSRVFLSKALDPGKFFLVLLGMTIPAITITGAYTQACISKGLEINEIGLTYLIVGLVFVGGLIVWLSMAYSESRSICAKSQ